MKKYLLIVADEFDQVYDIITVHSSSLKKAFDEVYQSHLLGCAYRKLYLTTYCNRHLIAVGESSHSVLYNVSRRSKTDLSLDNCKLSDGSYRVFAEEVYL